MRPLLFELTLPLGSLPLSALFGLLALLGAGVAFLGRKAGARDQVALGVVVAFSGIGLAISFRGLRYDASVYPIHAYGSLLAASLAVAWWLSSRASVQQGLPVTAVSRAHVAALACGLAGARALYAVGSPDLGSVTEVFAIGGGGLTLYGGLFAGGAGAWVVLRRERVRFLAWADGAAPGLCVALLLGRLASYLAGSDYGRLLSPDAPAWLRRLGTFPRWPAGTIARMDGSPAWVEQVLRGELPPSAPQSLPVHPTQLYEAAFAAVLFAGVVALRRRQFFRGASFLSAIAAYGVGRFALETFRGDPDRGLLGPLSIPQWSALVTTAASAVFLYGSFARFRASERDRTGSVVDARPRRGP